MRYVNKILNGSLPCPETQFYNYRLHYLMQDMHVPTVPVPGEGEVPVIAPAEQYPKYVLFEHCWLTSCTALAFGIVLASDVTRMTLGL
jgi:hypothetical protein